MHGDDFATVGTRDGVTWFKEAFERRFGIKSECIVPAAVGVGDQRVAGTAAGPAATVTNGEAMIEGLDCRLLNRVVRCTLEGWDVEPDHRRVDMPVQALELKGANRVTTPVDHEPRGKEEENEVELSPSEATTYRRIAARANYLAAHRPDLMYAVKELCRGMAKPTKGHWLKLKRLGRCLIEMAARH